VPRVATRDGLPSPESFLRHDDTRLSRRELVKLAGVEESLLDQLEAYGLISPGRGTRGYDSDDLLILATAHELAAYGLEPRHLRAFKAAADREIGLVEQVVAPQRLATGAAASARAAETTAELASLAVRLHATLVKAGVTRR
jgi:DNA-binding transcriptional MerR regulator